MQRLPFPSFLSSVAVAAMLLTAAAPAAAQAADALARCAAIGEDARRLACYDQASGRATSGTTATAPAPAGSPPASGEARPAPVAAAAPAAPARQSLIGSAWLLDPGTRDGDFEVLPYYPNYLLFGRWSDDPNNAPFSPIAAAAGIPDQQLDETEAKFQISFKARLWKSDDRRWGVWAAYTQQNQWQLYNESISRPFRETNYQPELMVAWDPRMSFAGFDWRLATLSFNHQSNGRADPLSRSWNRIIGGMAVERENLVLQLRAWYRIPESDDKDDNPDITDYTGYGDINAIYKWRGHSFRGMARGNFGTGKGFGELTWASPPLLGPLRLYAQFTTGYGESMIDYNWRQTTIGAGITINDLF